MYCTITFQAASKSHAKLNLPLLGEAAFTAVSQQAPAQAPATRQVLTARVNGAWNWLNLGVNKSSRLYWFKLVQYLVVENMLYSDYIILL